jgi:hypothetical protein
LSADTPETGVIAYVRAAAALAGIPLDEARAQAVAQHFSRSAAIAALLETMPLSPEVEPAEMYCPAPFPADDA